MAKKVNTKAFCKAWNEAVNRPKKENWDKIFDEYSKENPPFDNDRISLGIWLETYYYPPKRIEHEE